MEGSGRSVNGGAPTDIWAEELKKTIRNLNYNFLPPDRDSNQDGLSLSGFQIKILIILVPSRRATCTAHLVLDIHLNTI